MFIENLVSWSHFKELNISILSNIITVSQSKKRARQIQVCVCVQMYSQFHLWSDSGSTMLGWGWVWSVCCISCLSEGEGSWTEVWLTSVMFSFTVQLRVVVSSSATVDSSSFICFAVVVSVVTSSRVWVIPLPDLKVLWVDTDSVGMVV